MSLITRVSACLLVVSSANCAQARVLPANPTNLVLALTQAQPGDTIRLAPGNYEDVNLPARDNRTAVTIDATGATLRTLTIRNTAGWTWRGGVIKTPLPPTAWRNVMIDNARRIEIAAVKLTGGETGMLITRGSEDIVVRNNIATNLRSDGFNIATARRVTLSGNTCSDFHPTPPIYDAKGKLLKDGTHPDCIMMWSEPGKQPTSDITITNNRMTGTMQGISHFWHPKLGRDKVYRVVATGNIVNVTYWHGIMLDDTPGSIVQNNHVSSFPGSLMPNFPYAPIRTWLKASRGGTVACGNIVSDYPKGEGTERCASTSTLEREKP